MLQRLAETERYCEQDVPIKQKITTNKQYMGWC